MGHGKQNELLFSNSKRLFSIFPTATTKHPVFVKFFKIFLIFFEALSTKNKMLQKDIPSKQQL
jgi:hypothetical protein